MSLTKNIDDEQIPRPISLPEVERLQAGNWCYVSVDIETTSLADTCEIVQLSAVSDESEFNVYVVPKQSIATLASNVTRLSVVENQLLLDGKRVTAISLHRCLSDFISWLKSFGKPILLYGHNVKFDGKALLRSCVEVDLQETFFDIVKGFIDTLPLFKDVMPGLKSYKQSTLAEEIIGKTYEAHNALADAKMLRDMIHQTNVDDSLMLRHSFTVDWLSNYVTYMKESKERKATFQPLLNNEVISEGMASKMAGSGLMYHHLTIAYLRQGKDGLTSLLTEKDENKVTRVTNNKRIQNSIIEYIQRNIDTSASI